MTVNEVLPATERKTLAFPALVAGAIGIAFAPIFVRVAIRDYHVGPVAVAVHRMLLALPLLWFLAARERRRFPSAPSPWRGAALQGLLCAGLFFAGDLAVWHWSIRFTSVANATLLANFAPIFVTLVAWRFLGERVGWRFVCGMLLAIGGAALLLRASVEVGKGALIGDALGIATAVFYAGYQLVVKRLRATIGTFSLMSSSTFVSMWALLGIALVERDALLPSAPRGWWVLLGLAWVSQVGGQSLIAYGLAHLPSSFSSVSLLVQPMAAAFLAWGLLGEPLGPWQGAGGVLVLAGILLARRSQRARCAP